jgi:hypothetical protein
MANPFYVAPLGGMQTYQNVGNSIAGGINQYQENQALEQEQAKKQQLMQQASQVLERGNPQEIAQFSMQYPDIGAAMQGGIKFANDATKENMKQSMQKVIAGGDAAQILQERIQIVESNGGDATQSREELNVLSRMGADQYRSMVGNIYSMQYGVEGVPGMDGTAMPAGFREFLLLTKAAGLEPGSEGSKEAALVALGTVARAGESASERLARDPELARRVVELEQQTAAAKESGKLESQLAQLPDIRASIQTAEASAKSRGESLSDFNRAKAALPGLKEVVNQLIGLADVATYTLAGRAFDVVTKEFGFGATDGSTARAKMESLVNNQVLPLLRETFGAAFTREEGVELRKTMLDINASPAQKKEILNVFYDQKMRSLETTSREIDGGGQAPAVPTAPATQRIKLDADGNIIQ